MYHTSSFNSCILIYYSTRDQDQATNAEDVLFDMFKNEESGLVSVGKFLAVCTIKFIYAFLIYLQNDLKRIEVDILYMYSRL